MVSRDCLTLFGLHIPLAQADQHFCYSLPRYSIIVYSLILYLFFYILYCFHINSSGSSIKIVVAICFNIKLSYCFLFFSEFDAMNLTELGAMKALSLSTD